MKYNIKLIKHQLICEQIDHNYDIRYIQNEFEFTQIINKIIRDGFSIKKANNNLILCSLEYSIKLTDYQDILKLKFFERLKFHIQRTIEHQGFINLTNIQNISPKSNRNNKHFQSIITKVAALFLVGGGAINVFASTIKDEKQQSSNIPQEKAGIIEMQTEQPSLTEFEQNVIVPKQEIEEQNILEINLDFKELSNTKKAEITKENYYEIIEEKAKAYGLDPSLVLGIYTQERGIHSTKIDKGGGVGLAQIQYSVWINEDITAYKYNDLTQEFEPYNIHITDSMIRNLETNIELGCVILQNCLINSDYNIPVAVQMYNMGYGSMYKILSKYAQTQNKSVNEILSNPKDIGWLEFRENIPGDPRYLENVNQWIGDNTFQIYNFKSGENVNISFNNDKIK